jgi:4-hydroxy-tetrahydrodipicolinate synthase
MDAHGDVILGLKDSSGDLAYSTSLAREHPSLAVFPSNEGALLNRDAPFAGCISATLNVNAPLVAQALQTAQSDEVTAQALLDAATAIRSALASVPLVAAVKWALADLEHDAAWHSLMPPLRNLTNDETSALQRALAMTRYATLERMFSEAKAQGMAAVL